MENVTWLNASKATSVILAGHMMQVGLWAYIYPRGLTSAFNLRYDGRVFNTTSPVQPADDKPTGSVPSRHELFWPLLFAPREVGFGLVILILGGTGQWKAAGVVVGTVAGVLATTDGAVSGWYGRDGWSAAFWSHGFPAIVLGGVSACLLAN